MEVPAFAVWGANTGVGKSLVAAGLARAAAAASTASRVSYIKPVQTGFPEDSDARTVARALGINTASSDKHGGAYSVGPHAGSLLGEGAGESVVGVARDGEAKPMAGHAARTLFAWREPASPHLCVEKEGRAVGDEELVRALRGEIVSAAARGASFTLVETAGGVCSPAPSGRSQADALRPLRLPAVLVGDGALGGISTTLTAAEALSARGYDVPFVALCEPEGGPNGAALASALRHRDTQVLSFPPFPEAPAAHAAPSDAPDPALQAWLEAAAPALSALADGMASWHEARHAELRAAPSAARESLWWPFTQHTSIGEADVTVIDARAGESFTVYKPESKTLVEQYDACASWWTQGVGAELAPALTQAIAHGLGRYGHVMFPENAHAAALGTARKLLDHVGGGWASRVFFSDNGSTAIEVALKMAFKKFIRDNGAGKNTRYKVLALTNGYHGDTLGAMDAVPDSVFTSGQTPWYEPRGLFLDPPTVGCVDGKWRVALPLPLATFDLHRLDLEHASRDAIFSLARDTDGRLPGIYREWIEDAIDRAEDGGSWHQRVQVGACLIEPVLQGAGGMLMIDPLFQRTLVNVCKGRGIPVIYDEVFAGLWRLGVPSTSSLLHATPDIACYAKLLTGGVVPMACTVASEDVFATFAGDTKAEALLHGHSYTAHAIGCSAANAALDMFSCPQRNPNLGEGSSTLREIWDPELLEEMSRHPKADHVVALGTVLAVTLKVPEGQGGYSSNVARAVVQRLRPLGVFARPLGNVVYLMCGPTTPPRQAHALQRLLLEQL